MMVSLIQQMTNALDSNCFVYATLFIWWFVTA